MKILVYATGHGNMYHFVDENQNDLGIMSIEEFIARAPSFGVSDVPALEQAIRQWAMSNVDKVGIYPLDIDTEDLSKTANDLLGTGSGASSGIAAKMGMSSMPSLFPPFDNGSSTSAHGVPTQKESLNKYISNVVQEVSSGRVLYRDAADYLLRHGMTKVLFKEETEKNKPTYKLSINPKQTGRWLVGRDRAQVRNKAKSAAGKGGDVGNIGDKENPAYKITNPTAGKETYPEWLAGKKQAKRDKIQDPSFRQAREKALKTQSKALPKEAD